MAGPGRHSILIVDDSEDDAHMLARRILRVAGGTEFERVDSAGSMRKALAEREWDLVISDHSMPGFDSEGALRVLRESGRDVPFILYTGCLDEARGASAMRVGAHDWIDKHDPTRLEPVIVRELQHAKLRREKESAERSAHTLAKYDTLTRLPNRSLFCELVGDRLGICSTDLEEPEMRDPATVQDAAAGPGSGCVYYVDLDRFTRINDSIGYAAGDGLIRQVAARLRACAPAGALVARLGQDEFAIYLPGFETGRSPKAFADRVARRFSDPLVANGQEFFLTLSIGVSVCPAHGRLPSVLIANAESAMRTVKKLGGNDCRIFQAEIQMASSESLRLENDLRNAIPRKQLFLMFQPIFDMHSGRITGAEALLRWKHPELGLVPPDRFIPLADDTGQIHEIGEWVLERACVEARRWIDDGFPDVDIAVNFSATQFRHERFAERLRAIVARCGLPPARLEMEITEGAAMQKAETTVEILDELKRSGIRIAIDDFGTGYSSLSYLKRFPLDILKIDRSFMRDVPADPENSAIVRSIMALGRALRLRLLAEGVETREQYDFVKAEGCDRVQGYLLAKPLMIDEFRRLLEKHNRPAANDGFEAIAEKALNAAAV